MTFYYQPEETIAAIATAPGEGGVAIVRITGRGALDVAQKILDRPVNRSHTHTASRRRVIDRAGSIIDDVLILPMLGAKSYSGEDTVEIHCHGGSLVTRKILERALEAGARQAYPGEFTFKAFINGKIDLAQSEAIQELIAAKNERALEAAQNQLQGSLSGKIGELQRQLTDIAAIIEAWVDFPEEGLEFASPAEIIEKLNAPLNSIMKLRASYRDGRIIKEGISLCLAGVPNVGKSSLMNALLEKERAIVTHIPGTTRDLIEEELRLNGLNLRLTDTAGIRNSRSLIEKEGVRRSKEALKNADLILLVLDAHKGIEEKERQFIASLPPKKTIAVWNKTDLPHDSLPVLNFEHVVSVSAKKKRGLERLHKAIDKVIWEKNPPSKEEIVITSQRHKEALDKSAQFTQNVIRGLQQNLSPELIASDIRGALLELSKIIGKEVGEDILSSIFANFCVGK